MTVEASNIFEFSHAQIIKMAYRRCALIPAGQTPNAVEMAEGLDALELVIRELDAEGVRLRQLRYDTLVLTAGEKFVELSEDVFDVDPTVMFIDPDEADETAADNEIPVYRAPSDKINRVGAKSTESRSPSWFRLDKEQVPYRIELWPAPEDGGWIRVGSFRLAANWRSSGATPDLERHWVETLVNGVGKTLAMNNGLSLDRVGLMRAEYNIGKDKCIGQSNENVPQQLMLDHSTPWSNC